MLLTKVFEKGLSKVANVFSPMCTQNRKCCLKLFGIEQCFSTFCCQRNWEKLQQWFRGSLNVWQSISPIYTPLATTDHPSIPAEKHVIPPPPEKILHPPPPVIDPLKFLSSYRKGLRSIAALLPLLGVTWLLGFFIHWSEVLAYLFIILNSTQVLTVLCALQLLLSIMFISRVFCFILLGFGVLYLPWLLGWPGIFQLNSYSFGVSLMQNIVFLVVALWIGGLCTKTSTLRTLSRIADFLYLFVAVSLYLLQ